MDEAGCEVEDNVKAATAEINGNMALQGVQSRPLYREVKLSIESGTHGQAIHQALRDLVHQSINFINPLSCNYLRD